ncbi:hypothetical protein ACFV3O_32875, partial [Streptomyces albidoflavus]
VRPTPPPHPARPAGGARPAARGGAGDIRDTRLHTVPPAPRGDAPHGSLTGYAGGLERKTWLLGLEHTRTAVPAG